MLKEELRKHYSELRRSLSPEELDSASISITNKLLGLPIWSSDYYHIFLSIEKLREVNTRHLISVLSGRGKNIVVPKVVSGNHFNNFLLTDQTRLLQNRWGIPEPVEAPEVPSQKIDVVFLPLLAFDSRGHRVGYGKGFYDTFLSECREDIVKIGLSPFDAVSGIEDIHEKDVGMDYCVTPDTVYRF